MTATTTQFIAVLEQMGTTVTYHREQGGTICPCVSPEGFRSPAWHKAHPSEPICNEAGFLSPAVTNLAVKASIQPLRRRGAIAERMIELVGEIRTDDQIGFFPVLWGGVELDFSNWDDSGKDYILYDGKRYLAVSWDKFADIDGDPDHHFEVGLRLLKRERPNGS